jgi:acetyl esterase
MKALTAAGPALRRRLLTRPPIPTPAVHETVAFRAGPRVLADVLVPPGAEAAPTALVVHGGGFVGGARDMPAVRVLVHHLLARGLVVASIDYRLARPFGVRLADQVEDVAAAGRWWAEAAPAFGGDPERTVLIGLSAGGGLSLLAHADVRFAAFVGIYGAYDLTLLPARWASASLLTGTTDRAAHAAGSPLRHAAFPQPCWLVHGTADPLTPPAHAERLVAARTEAGLPVDLTWVEGGVHGFLQEGLDHPHTVQALDGLGGFLADHDLLGRPVDAAGDGAG